MDLSAILFPHGTITETQMKRSLSFFHGLSLCRPWTMESFDKKEEWDPFLRILHPPVSMKPGEDFKRILSEYRSWMKEHRGEGVSAFFRTLQTLEDSGDSSWDLMKSIRRMGKSSPPVTGDFLRWHLILHLAAEMEADLSEAVEMIRKLKRVKTPLEDATEDDPEFAGLFDDLPTEDPDLSDGGRHIDQILEAWIGLFGSDLDSDLLLTFDPMVVNYFAEGLERLQITLPDLSFLSLEEVLRVKSEHFGSLLTALKESMGSVQKLGSRAERFGSLSEHLKVSLPPSLFRKKITWSFLRLDHLPGPPGENSALSLLRGKTLVLQEEDRT
jgi:hypothetical protein